jgi:hypothetical protein
MPSPCSFRLGVVRSHHATEVQALRPAPLPPAAEESMKITGASRRSAAPGSQKVGAAEYGGDLCGLQHSWSARTKGRILGPLATMRIAASFPPLAQALAARTARPLSHRFAAQQIPEPILAAPPRSIALSFAASTFARLPLRPKSRNTHCLSAAMPPASKTAANPSFNLTRSGLRPPRAS